MRSSSTHSDPPRRADSAAPAAATNLFRREGEYWTIAYNGTIVRLRDTKGVRYIACLLRHPDAWFAAAALMATSGVSGEGSGVGDPTPETRNPKPPPDERARLAVTKRIKSAIGTIHAHYPTLGYHLSVAVKTGAQCAYLPDPEHPVVWTT